VMKDGVGSAGRQRALHVCLPRLRHPMPLVRRRRWAPPGCRAGTYLRLTCQLSWRRWVCAGQGGWGPSWGDAGVGRPCCRLHDIISPYLLPADVLYHGQSMRKEAGRLSPCVPCTCPPPSHCRRSGWGYMLSRDLAEYISNTALMYSAIPDK
jgi:hypothetical protein